MLLIALVPPLNEPLTQCTSERYLGDESARLRFLREARAAAKVRHSNVASVLHLGRTGNVAVTFERYFDCGGLSRV
jgi:serine/threonine protein kinase